MIGGDRGSFVRSFGHWPIFVEPRVCRRSHTRSTESQFVPPKSISRTIANSHTLSIESIEPVVYHYIRFRSFGLAHGLPVRAHVFASIRPSVSRQ